MATEGLWDYATDAELDAELAQYKTAAVDTVPQTQFPASSSGLDLSRNSSMADMLIAWKD